MTQQTMQTSIPAEKFQNAEQLWFWFLYARSVRNGFVQGHKSSQRRVCELLDVETLVTKLYLAGRLTDAQLAVMKEFGDRRRAPHQHIWAENKKAELWRTAMGVLNSAAAARGWIE